MATRKVAAPVLGLALLVAFVLFVWWYVEAEDFGPSRVAGNYVFKHDGITQRLTLHADQSFEQEDLVSGSAKRVRGTWRVINHGGIVAFSKEFMDAPEVRRSQETGDVYGIFKNYLGWVSITLDDNTTEIKAYKRFSLRNIK